MLRISKIAAVGAMMLIAFGLKAQNTYSPYSVFGVGDLQGMGLAHNLAMGGVGISTANPFHLNNKNPALLTANRVVVFETAVTMEQKDLSTEELAQQNTTGGLGYIAFGFPVIRDVWTMSVGLMPYSIVNYESQDLGFVPGTDAILATTFNGSGGITQAYFASGLKLLKGLSVGFRAAYLFGSIRQETEFFVENTNYLTASVTRNAFSDIAFSFGAAYRLELVKDQNYLNFGVTYDLGGDRNVTRLERLERRDLSGDPQTPRDDPPYLVTDDLEGSLQLPAAVGLGIGFEKALKWTVAADFTTSKWSEYRGFDGGLEGLADRTEIAIGGSYIPDPFAVGSYMKRVTYMLGFNYQNTPYLVNDQQIDDFGINFGVAFPLRNISRLTLAFKVGQRGTTDNDLIQERYYRAFLGITINDNKWFIRRKFD